MNTCFKKKKKTFLWPKIIYNLAMSEQITIFFTQFSYGGNFENWATNIG